MKNNILVLLGAIVGGVVGYFITGFVAGQQIKAMAIPGGLVGLGAGVATCRSIVPAILCGLLALGFGLFTEWRIFPFVADDSFIYLVTHVYQKSTLTLVMLAVGTLIGFWVPFRRIQKGGGV